MSFRLVVEAEAEAEITEAAAWYDAQVKGLGTDFIDVVDHALETIQRNPYQYQVIRKRRQVRRIGLKPFPYGLMYVASEREVVVVACIHGRRNPRRWQLRTR
jgi:plasmid stabilization system protein ParE